MWAKQSTAATVIVGPILDSSGAEFTTAVIGDLSISKNGGTLTALSGNTFTHIANGQYTLTLTTGNLDTLGRVQITCNRSTYQMPELRLMVVPAHVFDGLILGTDFLQVDAVQVANVTLAASQPNYAPATEAEVISAVTNGIADANIPANTVAELGTGSTLTFLAPASTALSTTVWTNTLATNLGTTNSRIVGTLASGTHNPQSGDAFARLGAPAGASIAADIAAIDGGGGSGTGARTVTITVNDGTTALQNAIVRMTEGVNTFTATTNASGDCTFNLDDATYTVGITKSGYSFAGTTLVVDGTETRTYSMTQIVPSVPSNPALCAVTFHLFDQYGNNKAGEPVEITFVQWATSASETPPVVSVTPVQTTDAGGLVEVELYRNATYRIVYGNAGYAKRVDVTVPDASSYTVEI